MARGPLTVVAAALLLLLAGCGGEPAGGPPEIQYGLEECGHCRMIISEEKHAAAIFDQAGVATRFDDVGCLLDYLQAQSMTPASAWVHDHASGAWIAAEPAFFVRDPRGTTPMGSGWLAFSSRQEAQTHATAQGAEATAWPSLLERRANH